MTYITGSMNLFEFVLPCGLSSFCFEASSLCFVVFCLKLVKSEFTLFCGILFEVSQNKFLRLHQGPFSIE